MRLALAALQRFEAAVLSGGILGIAALTIANVFARSVLGFSLAWAEELVQFAMVAVTFTGLSYAAGRGRHIRMTALVDQLDERPRKALLVATSAFTAALLAGLALLAVQYVGTVRTLGSVSPALRVPLWIVYAVAPIGLGLAAIHYVGAVAKNVQSDGRWLSWDVPEAPEPPDVEGAL